jgi:uncharacterized protein (TIGR02646 family)
MRFIRKGAAPRDLDDWFKGQPADKDGRRINCDYGSMPGAVKDVIKQRLLEDQGWLCCYTGIALTAATAHIEHLKPQSRCDGHEDIDYENLLAAYPGSNSARVPYGAHAKADWYDPTLLVSPLDRRCEQRFRFDFQGRIAPAVGADTGARETIARLGLAHDSLTEMRQQAIDEALFPEGRPLSEAQLRRVAAGFCQRDTQRERLPRFCFAITQAAWEVLRRAERQRRKEDAIRRQGRT